MDESMRKWNAFQTWQRERFLPEDISIDGPLMVPRFMPSSGYQNITVGKIGSGRSWNTGLKVLRAVEIADLPEPTYHHGLFDTVTASRQRNGAYSSRGTIA